MLMLDDSLCHDIDEILLFSLDSDSKDLITDVFDTNIFKYYFGLLPNKVASNMFLSAGVYFIKQVT